MYKHILKWGTIVSLMVSLTAYGMADLDINTPAISAIKSSMQSRHTQLAPYYDSGAIGLTNDGLIAIHDSIALPLSARQGINSLVSAENQDRKSLYSEIANGNGHKEWQGEIQNTFAGRWIDKAHSGWFYQNQGGWVKK